MNPEYAQWNAGTISTGAGDDLAGGQADCVPGLPKRPVRLQKPGTLI